MGRYVKIAAAILLVIVVAEVLYVYSRPPTTNDVQCTSTNYVSFVGYAQSSSYTYTYTVLTNATAAIGSVTTMHRTPVTTGALEHSDVTCTFIK